MSTTVVTEAPVVNLSPELDERVNAILAQTDWVKYGEEVSAAVEQEAEAYETARARSLAYGGFRFFR